MNNIDYEALNERVEAGLVTARNRNLIGLLIANLIIFVTFIVVVWLVLPFTNPSYSYDQMNSEALASLLLLSIGWLTGLILHAATTLTMTGVFNKMTRDRLTAQEIQRELQHISREAAQTATHQKPKRRHDRLVLSEDGELLDITADQWEDTSQQHQPDRR